MPEGARQNIKHSSRDSILTDAVITEYIEDIHEN